MELNDMLETKVLRSVKNIL